jgi:Peptidase A4 family
MTRVFAHRTPGAFAVCAACALVALLAGGSGGTHARSGTARSGVLIPSSRGEVLPLEGGTIHSINWSGYAVTSKRHQITAVSGSFVVPKVGRAPFGFAATWSGIGGFKTRDLIQAGTAENSKSGGTFGRQFYAWYELLPAGEHRLRNCSGDRHCRVEPGERIALTIRNVGAGSWNISITNSGHWHWSRRFRYSSSRSSAEWILEAPSLGPEQTTLAPVGTVHFGPTSRYTAAGTGHAIARGRPDRIILTGEAKPSALAPNGQSFNDCAYHPSVCPRP